MVTVLDLIKKQTDLKTQIAKLGIAIKAIQDVCEHKDEKGQETFKPIGHDSHYRHFECRICFKRIKV